MIDGSFQWAAAQMRHGLVVELCEAPEGEDCVGNRFRYEQGDLLCNPGGGRSWYCMPCSLAQWVDFAAQCQFPHQFRIAGYQT